jgi:hypothetical protein
MLRPLERRHLLEALRPPAGYDLERAIGTTYSLDLMTLLTVPLAFALFDWENDAGKPTADPLAILEAIRRYADRVHIFCQAGGISVPKGNRILLNNLEGIVHEVTAPRKNGIFHPKVWVLRFAPCDSSVAVMYRVLCLSRNLTFDRSWDTLLSLEGEVMERKNAYAANHPLANFVASLPGMMLRAVPSSLRQHVAVMERELRKVNFAPPEGFSDLRFHAIGIEGESQWKPDGRMDRLLIVSPFLDAGLLPDLAATEDGDMLVSRVDELNAMGKEDLQCFHKVYCLDPDADIEDADDTDAVEGLRDTPLQGLHAKLFVADSGWNARIWTGSVNATTAAFRWNVEFMVELTGKKSFCGVDAIMAQVKGETRFCDLLREYIPPADPPPLDKAKQDAENRAEVARNAIATARITGTVGPSTIADRFSLRLISKGTPVLPDGVEVKVWPVTLPDNAGIPPDRQSGFSVTFDAVSFEALTTFFAFEVKAKVGKHTAIKQFAVNVPVEGMPEDRKERLLRTLLKNRGEVIRFLLFLLADEGSDALSKLAEMQKRFGADNGNDSSWLHSDLSLLEPLLRTLHRNPEKLDRVAKLVEDLRKTPDGMDLLPPGLITAWEPIWKVRQELQQ